MGLDHSRRKFLKAGIALPAAGLVASGKMDAAVQSSPKMVYRTLGKTGLKVTGVGYGIGFVPVPEVVSRALDMGINYYDTARAYGDSEKIFSGIIKGRQRDKIVIATKSSSTAKADIVKDLETSLQTLNTDYVDIYHLHGRDNPEQIPDGAIEALEKCKQEGKARFIGFSCHDPNNMVDFVLKTGKFDVIQTS
ncbi:MAG: aldo/keto reductase [Acidobacteriota bacterium]